MGAIKRSHKRLSPVCVRQASLPRRDRLHPVRHASQNVMIRTPVIAVLALLLIAAAPPAKPTASKPATPRPAAAKPVVASFDSRDPGSLVALLGVMGAKAQAAPPADGQVTLAVTTPGFGFGVLYDGCDRQGRGCKGLAFTSTAEKRGANLAQLNSFNQTSITCRVFQDNESRPHVMYSALLFARDDRETLRTHVGVWQGCLASFGEFLADPTAYLARAP